MAKKTFVLEEETAVLFEKAAAENGSTPDVILDNFIKDYIVSGGHPETVANNWPWNQKGPRNE